MSMISRLAVAALMAVTLLPSPAHADAGPSNRPWRGEPTSMTSEDFVLGTVPEPVVGSRAGGTHSVRLAAHDRSGNAVHPAGVMLLDLETGAEVPWSADGATIVATAPEGSYSLVAIVRTGAVLQPSDYTVYADPELELSKDITLEIDARKAAEFRAVSPSPNSAMANKRIALWQQIAGQPVLSHVNGDPETTLHGFPSPPTGQPFASMYMETQTEPLDSVRPPKAYFLGFTVKGRIPESLTYVARRSDLARVRNHLAVQGDRPVSLAERHELMWFTAVPGEPMYGLEVPVRAPAEQDIYYTGRDMEWRGEFRYLPGDSLDGVAEVRDARRRFRPGRTYSETWDRPAFGPTAEVQHSGRDLVAVWNAADTGQPGRVNLGGNVAKDSTGRLVLRRNGEEVASESVGLSGGQWNVNADRARFEFDARITRDGSRSDYGRRIDARWRFTSTGADDNLWHRLLQVRATGDFDLRGRAPAGRLFPLDVRLERPPGGSAARSLDVRASYDDGRTWTRVPLIPRGTDRWTGLVRHPRHHNGFVSLRINASDRAGNAVDQTVIRAYGLRR